MVIPPSQCGGYFSQARCTADWRPLECWLSLLGTIGAATGFIVGVVKLGVAIRDRAWPYRGLQAWHHALGLVCLLTLR